MVLVGIVASASLMARRSVSRGVGWLRCSRASGWRLGRGPASRAGVAGADGQPRDRISRWVRRAMRRFEPATSRVRRLRSSFTIATFPGRNARTVSDLTGWPVYASHATAVCCPAPQGDSLRPGGRVVGLGGHADAVGRPAPEPADARARAPQSKRAAERNYKQMNDLSKDAVNWLAVGDDGAGQRIDNFLAQDPEGRAQEPHLPDPAQRRGPASTGAASGPDAGSTSATTLRVPPIRTAAPAARGPCRGVPPGRDVPPILFEDDALIALDKPAGSPSTAAAASSYGVIERLRLARPDAALPRTRPPARPRHVGRAAGRQEARGAGRRCTRSCARARSTSAISCWCAASGATRCAAVELPLDELRDRRGRAARARRRAAGARRARRLPTRAASGREARAAGRAARSRAGDRPHAPDPRAPRAPRAFRWPGDDKYGDFAWNRDARAGRASSGCSCTRTGSASRIR